MLSLVDTAYVGRGLGAINLAALGETRHAGAGAGRILCVGGGVIRLFNTQAFIGIYVLFTSEVLFFRVACRFYRAYLCALLANTTCVSCDTP